MAGDRRSPRLGRPPGFLLSPSPTTPFGFSEWTRPPERALDPPRILVPPRCAGGQSGAVGPKNPDAVKLLFPLYPGAVGLLARPRVRRPNRHDSSRTPFPAPGPATPAGSLSPCSIFKFPCTINVHGDPWAKIRPKKHLPAVVPRRTKPRPAALVQRRRGIREPRCCHQGADGVTYREVFGTRFTPRFGKWYIS